MTAECAVFLIINHMHVHLCVAFVCLFLYVYHRNFVCIYMQVRLELV